MKRTDNSIGRWWFGPCACCLPPLSERTGRTVPLLLLLPLRTRRPIKMMIKEYGYDAECAVCTYVTFHHLSTIFPFVRVNWKESQKWWHPNPSPKKIKKNSPVIIVAVTAVAVPANTPSPCAPVLIGWTPNPSSDGAFTLTARNDHRRRRPVARSISHSGRLKSTRWTLGIEK